jgi:diguanylate cyclase (GGDEF)-like protein/PAS domain S-box-containing protein
LRREKPRTVNWAGNYQSGLAQNAAGNFRLTPRKSFEIWCETWQGRSEPWSHADTGIAAMLGLSVPEALNKKHKLEAEQAKFRQAHQVSESSLQQFNKLTGAVPGVVYQFLVTPNGSWTYLYLSTYVRELFEVSPEDAYCDHSIMTSCIVEEHRESHHASIQAAAKNLTPWVHEHVIQTQSGSLKWVLGQALPEMQTDGSVLWHGIMTDITERKRAEEALRLTASVFAHAREGITVTDVEGSIVDINAAFSRITGYDRADVLGQNPRFLQSGKQDKAFYVAMWRDLIGQGYWEGEIWNRRKNGEVYPERLAIAAVRDAKGNTRQYVAMFSDISERKRIELELLKSEQKFRLVAENTSDGITIFGKNRTIEYVSPSVVKQLGYAESEELGRSNADVYALIHPESRDALFQTLNEAIENKSPSMTYSYRIKHKAGHYIWREDSTNFRYTSNGDYDGAYVVSRDITERKQAELELVRSKNRYQGILNNMMDAYWRIDANGRIVEANPAICQMHGYAKEELLQMSISDVEVIESAEDTRERIATIMREGRIAFQSQHRCSDGRIIDVEIAANLASDMPGAIDGFHHDITERKAMENDIRKLAFHDPLTQLPNRRLLRDRLGQMMATNKRSGFYGSVMFLDLDNFKPLNDVHGHDVGDLLLIETADRLKACVREMDTVARFGGDEFVVMIGELVADEVESKVHARNVAEKIRVALSGPYRLTINHDRPGNTTVTHNCTASIGVALFVNHDASPDEVLKWADAAMYKAKQDGRNLIRFHEQDGRETT